jgi:hypothetical protein
MTTAKITQTKLSAEEYEFTSDTGQRWLARKVNKGGIEGTYYELSGVGTEHAMELDRYYGKPWDLKRVKSRFEGYLHQLEQDRVDALYPGLVEAFSDAHSNSDIDGYGDEGAGYDHHAAIEEFMQSEAMQEYIAQKIRES